MHLESWKGVINKNSIHKFLTNLNLHSHKKFYMWFHFFYDKIWLKRLNKEQFQLLLVICYENSFPDFYWVLNQCIHNQINKRVWKILFNRVNESELYIHTRGRLASLATHSYYGKIQHLYYNFVWLFELPQEASRCSSPYRHRKVTYNN